MTHPPRCAHQEWRDLVIVISETGTECYERKSLLEKVQDSPFNRQVVSETSWKVYQQFLLERKKYLKPLKITLEEYLNGLLTQTELNKPFKRKKLGEGVNGTVWQYGEVDLVEKEIEDDPGYSEAAINIYLHEAPCCLTEMYQFQNGEPTRIIMPRYEGSMEKRIFNMSKFDLPEVLFQLVKGMYYAHARGVMHTDLKFENVFLTREGEVVIGDWGNAEFFPFSKMAKGTLLQTPTYRAPEVYMKQEWDWRVDIFSLGIMGYEMWKQKVHFLQYTSEESQKVEEYLQDVIANPDFFANQLKLYGVLTLEAVDQFYAGAAFCPPLGEVTNEPLRFLLSKMLCSDPLLRPTYAQILNDPFFDSLRKGGDFPEVSQSQILDSLRPFQTQVHAKNELIFEWIFEVFDEIKGRTLTCFLTVALCNQYRSLEKVLPEDLQLCVSACAFLAGFIAGDVITWDDLCYYAADSFTIEQLQNYVRKVAQTVKLEFFRSFPYLFLDNQVLPKECMKELILYHVNCCQDDPRTVAAYLGKKYHLRSQTEHKVPDGYTLKLSPQKPVLERMANILIARNSVEKRRTSFRTGAEIEENLNKLRARRDQ